MARKNPSMPKDSQDLPSPIPGIDNLPNAIGINQSALKDANEFPGHGSLGVTNTMKPNDGDQKDVAMPTFANGTDVRSYRATGSSAPAPSKVGADI